MQFSPQDEKLVDIVETAGNVAAAVQAHQLTDNEREQFGVYLEALIRRYGQAYPRSRLPNSMFREAINWYIDKYFHGELRLGNIVKHLMEQMILPPVRDYRHM